MQTTVQMQSKRGRERFTPFKVTFYLQTPIVLGSPWLNFDGIVSHLRQRELLGQDYYTLPSKEPMSQYQVWRGNTLQLFQQTRDVLHASVAQFDVGTEQAGVVTVYKRFHEANCHEINTKISKVQVGRGHFRAYMMKLPYLPARSVTFYCNGDMGEILRLIGYLPGLGKKTAYGYGMIKSVSADLTDENYSLVKDGVAMRPIPLDLKRFDSDDKMMLAYRAPYWDKRNVAPCIPPGAVVKRLN